MYCEKYLSWISNYFQSIGPNIIDSLNIGINFFLRFDEFCLNELAKLEREVWVVEIKGECFFVGMLLVYRMREAGALDCMVEWIAPEDCDCRVFNSFWIWSGRFFSEE